MNASPEDTVIEPASLQGNIDAYLTQQSAIPNVPAPQGKGCVGKKANVAAVIVAGGSGERFGRPGGKLMIPVGGKPLLVWSLQAFDAVSDVGLIVVCCPENRMEEYRSLCIDPYDIVTPVMMVPSGALRQESAMNGVEAVPPEFKFIAMHDGARPLIMPETVVHAINVLKGTLDADGVVCGHAAIDTLKVIDGGVVVGTPDRSIFWIAQTPQIFHADVLRQAHQAAMQEGYIGTDDSSLVERVDGRIMLVSCPRDNIKLTVPEDLAPIQAYLQQRYGTVEA
ncbi:MAG: 2-C-methyl-D-erythritol 4-phosphate cytidylyltransferase [Coriobacteriales bacterium]|nr:2-C-methyl-D-erythritol 4-phosphate cytidylyltransferase [Coriobacteriales bacterium]